DYLTDAQLAPIVSYAKLLWSQAIGNDPARLAAIQDARVEVGNLPTEKLGVTLGNWVLIDSTASGGGWFVDPTPALNNEFVLQGGRLVAPPSSPAYGHADLLTVVLHELGNVQGLPELPGNEPDIRAELLPAGERRLPDATSGLDAAALTRIDSV